MWLDAELIDPLRAFDGEASQLRDEELLDVLVLPFKVAHRG